MSSPMPTGDFAQSPYTGWTREHWVALADRTVRAVQPFASPRHALIHLPGPVSRSGRLSDGLEAYARTFLASAFRVAGEPRSVVSADLARWYAEGLVAGTDPESGESWPVLTDVPQARVEAASVAIGLHETREVLWNHLAEGQQQRVVEWLSGAVGVDYPGNNWVWFQNVVQAFLASVGGPTSAADVDRNLARVEEWYSGDGWYTDGAFPGGEHRCYDHYSGWAMHFYPLWWCRMSNGQVDASLEATYRARLRRYLEQAQHLIGGDGAPLYQGRSLTYRYAVLAPFWAGTVFDATPISAGRTRRLASGVLRYFYERGGWDGAGLQPIGWHGEMSAIRQWYSGPGSPYWSSKGLAGLVLPPSHPVWAAVEEAQEVERGDVARTLPAPGWLVSATQTDGIVRVVNHGGDHHPRQGLGLDESVYGRLSYSGAAAPDSGLVAETSPVDSSVVLVDAGGRASHRRPLERLLLAGRVALSRHRAHWLVGEARDTWQHETDDRPDAFDVGPWLTVASVLRGAVEVRVVRVDAVSEGPCHEGVTRAGPAAQQVRPWRLRVGGHTVAGAAPPDGVTGDAGPAASAEVGTGGQVCAVVIGLMGEWEGSVQRTRGVNALGEHTATPLLTMVADVQDGDVGAAAVVLTGDPTWRHASQLPLVSTVHDSTGCVVDTQWPDGEVDRFRLDPPG